MSVLGNRETSSYNSNDRLVALSSKFGAKVGSKEKGRNTAVLGVCEQLTKMISDPKLPSECLSLDSGSPFAVYCMHLSYCAMCYRKAWFRETMQVLNFTSASE